MRVELKPCPCGCRKFIVSPLFNTMETALDKESAEELVKRWNAFENTHIDIVFDGPPGPEAGRFVEIEDMSQTSASIGEWIHRSDGYWVLRISDPRHPKLSI